MCEKEQAIEDRDAWKARAEEAEALAERRRIEREQALNVTTREGLSASEWLMRTAQAEARAEKAEAELEKLRSTDHSIGCAIALATAAASGRRAWSPPRGPRRPISPVR